MAETPYSEFVKYLSSQLLGRFSGKGLDRFIGDKPSRGGIFIGTLLPRQTPEARRKAPERAMPSEAGIEVLCPENIPPDAWLEIEFSASFFYRVFPSLQEQLSIHEVVISEDEESESRERMPEKSRLVDQEIRRVFKKSGPHSLVVNLDLPRLLHEGKNWIEIPEADKIARMALAEFEKDQSRYRPRKYEGRTVAEKQCELRVPSNALKSDKEFGTFLDSHFAGKIPSPGWHSGACIRRRRYKSDTRTIRLSILLQNRYDEKMPREDLDNTMFDVVVRIRPHGFKLEQFVLNEIREQHQYDNRIDAIGINCAVRRNEDGWIEAVHSPILMQFRYKAKPFKKATIKQLGTDPLPYLVKLADEMQTYVSQLKNPDNLQGLSEIGKFYFNEDTDRYVRETTRFAMGVEVLKDIPEALEAFRLANQAFALSSKGFENWYYYQIVFLVGMIPDLVAPRHPEVENFREKVDVIYFPTGGGKTETYLGCVVYQMFYDRLCGKKAGITAITKFPLRLLSLQQIQRIADVFGAAEKIRRTHPVIGAAGYDRFSTGYYVGEKNTPNRLYKPRGWHGEEGIDEITPVIKGDPKCEGYKIITVCPFCAESNVKLVGDLPSARIKLVCDSCKEEIPVYISDDEIYRYLPTFLIGTLDKMAACGRTQRFRHLFGQVNQRCPDHGYLSGGRCLYYGNNNLCKRKTDEYENVSLDDPTPSILIQDEMHLVRESLGSYDSHYETFLDKYQSAITNDKKRIKIITATATISDFESQIRHLYMREGFVFPARGRTKAESFYGYEDRNDLARVVVGILPHSKTMLHTVLDIVRNYYELTRAIEKDPRIAGLNFTTDENHAKKLLALYKTMLSYNLMKMQGDAVGFSVSSMINSRLRLAGYEEINYEPLTGEVTFGDVRRVLEILETKSPGSKLDLITATSMISHGVDIDVLNFMVFQGMPTSTAEYIQAQSRVGRKFPGIVFMVFNHNRERDASYYKFFYPYHELRDLLIEPVPINRWAKYSIDRTLPGIFTASIMNYFEPVIQSKGFLRLYMSKDFKTAMQNGALTEDEIVEFLLGAYRISDSDMGTHFEKAIRSGTARYVGDILSQTTNKFIPYAITDEPLANLRDVDIQIDISRTAESYEPMERIGSRYRVEE